MRILDVIKEKSNLNTSVSSSFRDPSGQVYIHHGEIYRQINRAGYSAYQQLIVSGLYEKLQQVGYLIPHQEVPLDLALTTKAQVVIKPQKVHFISYPYEWSFSQLKDAALVTLEIAKIAIEFGMILKDASAYNIQFHRGKTVLIDTGSFVSYQEGKPWVAYNQFCKHFLAPLTLMAKKDVRLNLLLKQYIDGIPLDLACALLPLKTKFSFSLLSHLHLHAKAQEKFGTVEGLAKKVRSISKTQLLGLLDNLSSTINKLNWKPIKSEWGDYYNKTNYSDEAAEHKKLIIKQLTNQISPKMIWDLGGNNGLYSRIAGSEGALTICFDVDPIAVETNYQKVKRDNSQMLLPLIQDLTNPSSGIGWAQKEREGLLERGTPDLIMALALIHHLAISNNVPLGNIAHYFSLMAPYLIIEFVPKEDTQVKRLLASREDIFFDYYIEGFKEKFSNYYRFLQEIQLNDSNRILFLMERI